MKVIVIEDNPDHFEIIEDAFAGITDSHFDIVLAASMSAGQQLLFSGDFDICLCDLQLPDSSIAETVDWLSTQTHAIPMITLTSLNSIEVAQSLLNSGVQDYISKDTLTPQLLFKSCLYAVERFKHQKMVTSYNQDMEVFCASLSHDFNGHISRITSVAQALKSDLLERITCTEAELKWFDYIDKSTTEVHNLVSDLQSYLSLGVGQKNQTDEKVDLKLVIDNVLSALKNELQIEIKVNMPTVLTTILGSPTLLQLLFQNLLSNSVKFNNSVPVIDISVQDNGNYVEVILQDNGIGFDPIHAQNIFSPFNRLDNGKRFSGSGLGLSIVKRIVEYHRGNIKADSELNVGSKFTLNFKKIA